MPGSITMICAYLPFLGYNYTRFWSMIDFLGYPNFTVKYVCYHTVKEIGLGIKCIDSTITKKLKDFKALSQQQIDPILISVKKVLTSVPLTTHFSGPAQE